ncbi:cytidylyltransferase domain-containing protein [Microbacterium sp. CJ77]|uniref:cytidylyltransferase domain-containing protein n=1 Tax=Microbacterium sp. CJ77 TaxID=2079201 RepID=UPI0015E19D13|nr:glycosyltransferase family protein [Microbacterium sp. CJ77]
MGGLLVIQARLGSSRLPAKVLADIDGRSMLQMVIERAGRAHSVDEIVVATTTDSSDDELVQKAQEYGADVIRGDSFDVLARFGTVLDAYPLADPIVRVTADCPFIDAAIIDRLLDLQKQTGADYVSNRLPPPWKRTSPVGLDVEVVRREALEIAIKTATDDHDREHVMPYLYRHPDRFSIVVDDLESDLSTYRWTVDTPEDLQAVREIAHRLGPEPFGWMDVLRVASNNPWIAELNATVTQKAVHEVDGRWERPVR